MWEINLLRRFLVGWVIIGVGLLTAWQAYTHWDGHPSQLLMAGIGLLFGFGVSGFVTWFFTRTRD
jgi:1,4-dihydroxy-2-naphthoate octaprenyltransferase